MWDPLSEWKKKEFWKFSEEKKNRRRKGNVVWMIRKKHFYHLWQLHLWMFKLKSIKHRKRHLETFQNRHNNFLAEQGLPSGLAGSFMCIITVRILPAFNIFLPFNFKFEQKKWKWKQNKGCSLFVPYPFNWNHKRLTNDVDCMKM